MGCWVSQWNTHNRTKCKQKVFCCEMIHSALAISCFGQDNWLLGTIAFCIDSQRKVPNPSYFSIISIRAVLLLLCRALLLVSKHQMLGVVCRSSHPGKESSPCPCSFQQWLLFFLPWLHKDRSAAGMLTTAMLCIRRVSWTAHLLPGSASLVVVVCVAQGTKSFRLQLLPFLCFSEFCYYPLL